MSAAKINFKSVPQAPDQSIMFTFWYSSTKWHWLSGNKLFRALQYFELISHYSPFILLTTNMLSLIALRRLQTLRVSPRLGKKFTLNITCTL